MKTSSPNIWMAAVAVGLALGFALGYIYLQPQVGRLESSEASLKSKTTDLESKVSSLQAELSETRGKLSLSEDEARRLEASLNDAAAGKDRLESLVSEVNSTLSRTLRELALKKADLEDALVRAGKASDEAQVLKDQNAKLTRQMAAAEQTLKKLDADRMLLLEFRKDMPSTREEVKDYWKNMKSVAAKVDPALGSKVDRVIERIDAYFDWIDGAPNSPDATPADWGRWLFNMTQEAAEYGNAIGAFQSEAYFAITVDIAAAIEAAG